ncbi:hypothetical protein K490DRAFT_62252 [Saccharata proteae CBS 121410]|uniref:DRBM domain-containing protein n=1 Tax=Saccharata proteae CBS 121410 TaxID=1314787 RepID=A0A9P4HX86_9PEZI|nr:hypothetical protein K490DRAFT_62252 [Saccharata proteae CBS 121410]
MSVTNMGKKPAEQPQFSGIPGLMPMADFEKMCKDSAKSRTDKVASSANSTSTSTVTPSKPAKPIITATPVTPLPAGKAFSYGHIIRFHELCQAKGYLPELDFVELLPAKFTAKLTVAGQTITAEGPFPSKKEAKAAVCEMGLKVIEQLPSSVQTPPKQDTVNWIGTLLEYCSKTHISQPTYQDYQSGEATNCLHFSCELTIPQYPDQIWGGRDKFFRNKKDAKTNASREAVEWLRANGHMSDNGSSKKKAKVSPGMGAGSTKVANSPVPRPKSNSPLDHEKAELDRELTYTQQVVEYIPKLKLSQPEYRLTQDEEASGFWSGAAYFQSEGGIEVAIGKVSHVYGQKAAKNECAKRVLAYLKGSE